MKNKHRDETARSVAERVAVKKERRVRGDWGVESRLRITSDLSNPVMVMGLAEELSLR